jgi:RNA polymerase sigma factor (sigma-70 family)
LPSGVSEADFLKIVGHIAKQLSHQFSRVHGSPEDFFQEVTAWCLEALPKYDSSRPLANYLYRHARNRALNYVRDHVSRFDPPCKKCHSGHPCGPDGTFCRKYAAFRKRNLAKANLSKVLPAETGPDRPSRESPVEDEVLARELAEKIEAEMPPKLREDYAKLLAGDWRDVSVSRRARIQRIVAEILGDESLVTLKSR